MKPLISAIEFLTILPIGKPPEYDPGKMVPFFPIVGMILGTLVSILDQVALRFWPAPVAALLDVVFFAVLTGALHLDGLGDTADGLFGHRPREQALAVMKDSRIGAMGLVAIACGLSIKWGGIMNLGVHRSLLLVIIPAYARGSMLFGIRGLPYGRPEGGIGRAIFDGTLKWYAFWGLLAPVVLTYVLGWRGALLNVGFIMTTLGILRYYKKRLGCITGDMLGAMTEVTESVLFLLASI